MTKKITIVIISLIAGMSLIWAADDPGVQYIIKYSRIAVSEMKRTGVPASITLAQGILESNYGRSTLAKEANNHFGVKCHKDWSGKKFLKDAEIRNECFRAYPAVETSFMDHSDFLRYQNRYKFLFDLKKTDYKGWAYGLKKAGYATDPAYPQKLIALIEKYQLYNFDDGVSVEVPAPLEVEKPVLLEQSGVKFNEQISVSLSRKIYTQNGVPFIYAMEGETLDDVARKYSLFKKEIMKFNDMTNAGLTLKAGDVVYLKSKKNQAARGLDKYVVGEDESVTLWKISQRYGIKLSALEKMNPYAVGTVLEAGDTILLRSK